MFGPGSNEGAYDYSPFPGTSTRQQQNLKDYDKKYGAAAEKLRKQGYVVNGDNYFKRVPDASKPGGYTMQKVGKVNTGHNNEALKVTTPKPQNPAAPPKAVVDSNGSNGARSENRSGVTPVNDSFRTAVKQGPDGKVTPSSGNAGGGTPQPQTQTRDQRVNTNGLVSYGKDLSSLNQFTREFTGGYEVADIKSAFQSEDLPGAYNGSNKIGYQETPYELPEGAAPSPLDQGLAGTQGLTMQDTGYTIGEASVPGTIGRSGSAQEGSSDKPDIAEEVRTIRMRRKGPRDDGGPRGFAIDRANEMAQNSVSETKGNGMNERRRAIRGTFLNHEGNSIQAITAARAVAGVGNDSNGSDVYNVGGKLVYAKAGEEQKAINTLMSGHNPMAHLDMPTTADTQPDSPADSQLSPSFAKETPGAQDFFKTELKKVKDKIK